MSKKTNLLPWEKIPEIKKTYKNEDIQKNIQEFLNRLNNLIKNNS